MSEVIRISDGSDMTIADRIDRHRQTLAEQLDRDITWFENQCESGMFAPGTDQAVLGNFVCELSELRDLMATQTINRNRRAVPVAVVAG